MGKLERREEKLDESIYPPETSIKPVYQRRVKSIEASVAEGTCVQYDTMDDFLKSVPGMNYTIIASPEVQKALKKLWKRDPVRYLELEMKLLFHSTIPRSVSL